MTMVKSNNLQNNGEINKKLSSKTNIKLHIVFKNDDFKSKELRDLQGDIKKHLGNFITKTLGISANEIMNSNMFCKPDTNQKMNAEDNAIVQLHHFKLSKKARIFGYFTENCLVITSLDVNHDVHNGKNKR